jgi:hypothetical protein
MLFLGNIGIIRFWRVSVFYSDVKGKYVVQIE